MKGNFKKLIPSAVFILVFFVHLLYFNIFAMKSDPKWWTFYLRMEQYLVGFSFALAFAYGAFTIIKMRGRSKGAAAGSAIIAFFVWFTSCCGAPILVVILGVLGITAGSAHLSPRITTLITIGFVSLGYLWLRRKVKGVIKRAKLVCVSCKTEAQVPVVHCGPGILGPEEGKIYCPCWKEGHTEYAEIPKHCGLTMKYVEE